jgi:hypothetical protein
MKFHDYMITPLHALVSKFSLAAKRYPMVSSCSGLPETVAIGQAQLYF